MADIVDYYLDEMHNKFKYYAAWLPGISLRLGDVGIINDQNQFLPKTSLKNKGITFEVLEDAKKDDLKYVSTGGVSISMKAAGELMAGTKVLKPADIGFLAEFGRENAVVFQADGVVSTRIEDIDKLTTDMAAKAEKNEWKKEWVVITELIAADSSTIQGKSRCPRAQHRKRRRRAGCGIRERDAYDPCCKKRPDTAVQCRKTGIAGYRHFWRYHNNRSRQHPRYAFPGKRTRCPDTSRAQTDPEAACRVGSWKRPGKGRRIQPCQSPVQTKKGNLI